MSLLMEMLQAVVFTMAFLLMFQFLGMRGAKLRGDFVHDAYKSLERGFFC